MPIIRLALPTLLIAFVHSLCAAETSLILNLRDRVESEKGSALYDVRFRKADWDARKTAVVICDMWDKHWCEDSTRRVGEMAPRMNQFVAEVRKRGALIIHAPSDTMDYYKTWPQYKLAQDAPKAEAKSPLERWRKLDPAHESPLPIDDTDGGCECSPDCKPFKAWSHQIDAIEIKPEDAITDTAQAYHLMKQRGIENVLVMGVHLNMCVLGRPFSIRQLVAQGLNVALVRDLTDTMYNPKRRPFVAHCTGTDLMVEHVEKFWCPSFLSTDLLGGSELRFSEDKRPTLLIISAEDEYKTAQTLPKFALEELGRDYRVQYVFGHQPQEKHWEGLAQIESADALLLSVRRRVLVKEQLDSIRKFIAAGKPLIAIRTACHAFTHRGTDPIPPDCDEWLHFDKEILGCNYANHYPDAGGTRMSLALGAEKNPLSKGLESAGFTSHGTLYKVAPLEQNTIALLMGTIPEKPSEPVAWTRTRESGERIFCTTLGHPGDFEQPQFRKLLKNGIDWAVQGAKTK